MSEVDQLGSKDFVTSSPENGQKKKSFLERMREREERQSKVKLSPSNVRTQYYKKPSSRDKGPIGCLKTSPAIKKIIKEEFNREKVNYCFLPEKQIQLQMIQKFKGHVDSLKKKKNFLSKKAGDDNLENNSFEEEAEKIGSSFQDLSELESIPLSDHLPKSSETAKTVRKFTPRGDRKSEKCVKFLFPSDDDSDEPPSKIRVRKTPVKPNLRLANDYQVQVTPIKSRVLEVVNITDSQTTPIKSLEEYRDNLERGISEERFKNTFDPPSKKPLENDSEMFLVSPTKIVTEHRRAKLIDSSNNRKKEDDDNTLMKDAIDEFEGNVLSKPTKSNLQQSKPLTSVTEISVVRSPLNTEDNSLFNRQNKNKELTGNDLNYKFQVEDHFSPEKPQLKLSESPIISLPLPLPSLVFPDDPLKLSEVNGEVKPPDHDTVVKLSEEVNSEDDLNCSVDMFSDVEDAIDSSFDRSSKCIDQLSKMKQNSKLNKELRSTKPLTSGTEITVIGSPMKEDSSTMFGQNEDLGSSEEFNTQKCPAKFCLSSEMPQSSVSSSETFSGGEAVDKIEMALVTTEGEDGEAINDKNNPEQITVGNDELLHDNMINESAILDQIMPIEILTADQGSSDDMLSDVDENRNLPHCLGESMEDVGYQVEQSSVVAQEALRDVENLSHDNSGGSPEEVNENDVPSVKKKKTQFEILSSGMSSSSQSQKSSQSDGGISAVVSNGEETNKQSIGGFLCDLFSDVEEDVQKTTEDDDESEDEENYKIF